MCMCVGGCKKEEKGLRAALWVRFAMLEQPTRKKHGKLFLEKSRSRTRLLASVEYKVLSHSFVFA